MANRPGGVGRVVQKKARSAGREWLKRLLTALFSMLLSIFGTYSYAQTGKVIPRRELLSGTASFHFIDVGQGDATLILTGDAAVLIDTGTGDSAGALAAYLKTYVGRLDYLILTHPHDDHVGGADEVLESIPVGRVLMPLVEHDGYTESLMKQAAELGIPVFDAKLGGQYAAGDITCTLLGPVRKERRWLGIATAASETQGMVSAANNKMHRMAETILFIMCTSAWGDKRRRCV